MKKNILFACCCISIFLSSCGSSEDNCNQVFFAGAAIFNEEVADVNEAAQQWADNPTAENCLNYRSKVEIYVDRLTDFRQCIPTSQLDDFDDDIDEIEDQLDDLDC